MPWVPLQVQQVSEQQESHSLKFKGLYRVAKLLHRVLVRLLQQLQAELERQRPRS